jgi:Ran-binding protein 3
MDEDKEVAPVVSPRRPERKRSRDQFDKDLEKEELEESLSREKDENASGEADPDTTARCVSRTSRDEPEKKRHRDTSQEADSKEEKKLETKVML